MVTKISVAHTLTCQINAILKGENPVVTMQNNNGITYHVLLKMPFTPIDEGYYIGSWQMYRYAIVFHPCKMELSLVSMLGEKEWGNTHRCRKLDEKDPSDDILHILDAYTELGKQYYDCEDIDCIFNQNKYRGLERIDYIWHGSQADLELIYDGESFCYWDVEDALYETFKEEVDNKEVPYVTGKSVGEHFNIWLHENEPRVYGMLDEWVANLRCKA